MQEGYQSIVLLSEPVTRYRPGRLPAQGDM
jgi:hypothetical protein